MAHRVTTAIQKGGTGKTTTAINLGGALAKDGEKVLLVDMDPQGGLTEGVGLPESYTADHHIGEFLTQKPAVEDMDPSTLIVKRDPFWVIPANRRMFGLGEQMINDRGWFHRLSEFLDEIEQGYDWLVIDSPPEFGRLSDSAIIAAQNIIIPVFTQEASIRGLEQMIEEQIVPIREDLGIDVRITAIVPNMTLDSAEKDRVITGLQENFEEELVPFEIRKRIDIGRAWRDGQTLFEYDPDNDMCDRYQQLADTVRRRVDRQEATAEVK